MSSNPVNPYVLRDILDAITAQTPGVGGGATTGTKSNVSDAATSTVILAANTARKGAIIWNDSAAGLYLDLSGGTASATSASVPLAPSEQYVLDFNYTGAITGIWTADTATGAARITEFT